VTPSRILYITFDGLLEPLGRSQVFNYLSKLSERGFKFTVISLEKPADQADTKARQQLENDLAARGIKWLSYPYRSGGLRSVLMNCLVAFRAARQEVHQDRVAFIHARSYVPALIAWFLKRRSGVPYLFDMRGYWIDELADDGRWFTNQTAYKVGKKIERSLVRDATAIVTLTNLQANDLRQGELREFPNRPIVSITTCADYDEFALAGTARGAVPAEIRQRLQGKLVVGLVGSINSSYCISESLSLFRFLCEARNDAHLLCLTRQLQTFAALLEQYNVLPDRYTLITVAHQDMPEWLKQMHWALLLLNSRFSKRGSMPTKLAEFFAAGVRPIQYGCNEEVSARVREAGSGLVLEGLSPEDLREAALKVARTNLDNEGVMKAREITRPNFSLEAGVNKYATLFDKLLGEGEK
jgi:glycosyltransferase involved in cell wall biosynthesis